MIEINLKRIAVVAAIISSPFILSACNLYKTPTQSGPTGQTGQTNQTAPAESAATVTFSDAGVSPTQVTVKSGQAITWTNNGSKKVQVASDNHPTHTINQELTSGQFTLELAPGASATVTLTKAGTWGFHDHLSPSVKGKVVVE